MSRLDFTTVLHVAVWGGFAGLFGPLIVMASVLSGVVEEVPSVATGTAVAGLFGVPFAGMVGKLLGLRLQCGDKTKRAGQLLLWAAILTGGFCGGGASFWVLMNAL